MSTSPADGKLYILRVAIPIRVSSPINLEMGEKNLLDLIAENAGVYVNFSEEVSEVMIYDPEDVVLEAIDEADELP